MKIYCVICKIYVGEIKEAKLRKEISFLCKNCTSIIKLKMPKQQQNTKQDNTTVDFLRDMFNMKG